MKRWFAVCIPLILFAVVISFSPNQVSAQAGAGWITLFDGSSLDNWNMIGDANWRLVDGVAQADKGNGYLVSKNSYDDFEVRAEFWVDAEANSGVFLRCSDPTKISAANAYEVNIFDARPDPTYGTGSIVNVAKPSSFLKAANKWNTYDITAKGTHFTVILNGTHLIDADDSKHAQGPIGLQYGAGVVKFRKVEIKPL
jgi:hypothetical protein